jgi:hypothetical protein
MHETLETDKSARIAHAPNVSRRSSLVKEQKQNRLQMGLRVSSAAEKPGAVQLVHGDCCVCFYVFRLCHAQVPNIRT